MTGTRQNYARRHGIPIDELTYAFRVLTPPECEAIKAAGAAAKGKPAAIVDKIVTGRVEKLVKTKLLLDQPYIRDPSITVKDLISQYITKMGENIRVSRFVRFNVGEGQTKSEEEE